MIVIAFVVVVVVVVVFEVELVVLSQLYLHIYQTKYANFNVESYS